MTALSVCSIDKRPRMAIKTAAGNELSLLLDSGANVSCLTLSDHQKLGAPPIQQDDCVQFYAANNSELKVQGSVKIEMKVGDKIGSHYCISSFTYRQQQ